MAKATCHARSISLPSRTHPVTACVEKQLHKLKELEATTTSVCNKLGDLKELYERVNDLLQLPLSQQVLSDEHCSNRVENVLDGSLRVLDVCSTTRDVFTQIKESVQELESSLRRRRGGESGLESEVEAYLLARKKLNKEICKCVNRMEKNCKSSFSDKDSEPITVISVLAEVEQISFKVLNSVVFSISQPRSKLCGWSRVSKLLKSRRVSCEGNQVENIDSELSALKSSKDISLVQVQRALKGLEAFELSIQEVEEDLESVFRQLVKTRVSFLNILNH